MPIVPVPRRQEEAPPETPEQLYDGLTVTDPNIGELWRRQSHVLGRYYQDHRDGSDVALELPTGAGKTLVGLLIADWRRLVTGESSAFVCPTRQLARQAHEKAAGYGIPTVLLIGPNQAWDPAEVTRGLSGEATIVSVYSHVFNTAPRVAPRTLVLDDAHAAEGPVAENWSVSIDRDHAAYEPLLDAVGRAIAPERLAELRNDDLTAHALPPPELIGPKDLGDCSADVLAVLDEHLDGNESAAFALSEIRGHLPGCLMFAGWQSLLIRPFVPPTRFHGAFEEAEQRVYLSATLGQAGELERSFGRVKIPRVETPADWERRGSGRRLALLPRAGMQAADASAFIKETIARFTRALVLVPSNWEAEEVTVLLPEGWDVLRIDDVDERLHPFQESTYRCLVLANRYDGIDLPGDQCEVILISGLPTGTHLQDRFLYEAAGAKSALRERIRTRLMQGMGRATRSRNDHAVVLMAGESLIDFLRDRGNLVGLRAELQAELGYGLYLAQGEHDLNAIIESFLERDADWDEAEQYLTGQADEADLEPPAGAEQLQRSATSEVLASEAAWRGELGQASVHAQAAVRSLTVGAVGAYRTFWKVLAAHWAAQHAEATGDPVDARVAAELGRDAAASARTRAWRPPVPAVAVNADAEALDTRAMRIASKLQEIARSPRGDRYIESLAIELGKDSAPAFERGIERMGQMLGFEAVRPNLTAAPDGAWRDGSDQILWEAKSEQQVDGVVSAGMVRQANTHPTWVRRELDWASNNEAITILVTPRRELDEAATAVANEGLYLMGLDSVRQLGEMTTELWRALIGEVHGLSLRETADRVSRELVNRGLDTDAMRQSLMETPIARANVV